MNLSEMAMGGKQRPSTVQVDEGFTRIPDAVEFFASHIHTHSPAKPRTLERYKEVLSHFERLLGKKKYVEAISRLDIDDYKIARSKESAGKGKVTRCVAASTINFEVTVLRSFFYYLIRERGIKAERLARILKRYGLPRSVSRVNRKHILKTRSIDYWRPATRQAMRCTPPCY